MGGHRPLLLSSTVRKENDLLTVDLSNPDLTDGRGEILMARGDLHLFRAKFLYRGVCFERVKVTSFGRAPIETELVVVFDADFADIFEVRGMKRKARGRDLPPKVSADAVTLAYRGLDGTVRRTRLAFAPAPARLTTSAAYLQLHLAPRQEVTFDLTVTYERGPAVSRSHHARCQSASARIPGDATNPAPVTRVSPVSAGAANDSMSGSRSFAELRIAVWHAATGFDSCRPTAALRAPARVASVRVT